MTQTYHQSSWAKENSYQSPIFATLVRSRQEIVRMTWILPTVLNVPVIAFGALRKSIYSNARVSTKAKTSVYESLILPIVLYRSESWCLTEKLFNMLRLFHRNCVRAMCRVNLVHVRRYRNQELLDRLGLMSIDCYVTKRQLAWAGHLARMDFDRLPRKLLSSGSHLIGHVVRLNLPMAVV